MPNIWMNHNRPASLLLQQPTYKISTAQLTALHLGTKERQASMKAAYEQDVVAWANEQAALLRAGQLCVIDAEHIAQEIEDVGKSEQRELANRMVVLLTHLLKWQYQPERRSKSWTRTITVQRKDVAYVLAESPSLRIKFADAAWLDVVWGKAVVAASDETGLDVFPDTCPWPMEQVLSDTFLPS
jgi:hypothetical protein